MPTAKRVCRLFRYFFALLLLLLHPLLLTGCDQEPSGKIFRYDMSEPVETLDPQFATGSAARTVVANLFEGLLLRSPDGEFHPGVAESYTVSGDGLVYSFLLRNNAAWSSGDPVTADDFAFALLRLFRDESPHADKFTAIQGSSLVRSGAAANLSGVRVEGPYSLTITLDQPDPLFLSSLCDPAASPCNEKAFEAAVGRYGMGVKLICSNGPFEVTRWDESRLDLRQCEVYRSERETVAGGVTFYFGRDSVEKFSGGASELALLNWEQQELLEEEDAQNFPLEKTVWCIVFNLEHPIWKNPLLRQGLACAIDRQSLLDLTPASFHPTSTLVPGAMQVMGKPYRELAFKESPLGFDTSRASRLFNLGLDTLDSHQLPSNAAILVPENARIQLGMNELQQSWQQHLTAFINFEATTPEQIQNRFRTGDYQMLVMPMTPADENIETLLGAFESTSEQNYTSYRSLLYDDFFQSAGRLLTAEAAATKYSQAEAQLLSDAVVIPLFYETTYMAARQGVSDLQISPFGDLVYFKYGLRDN